MQDKNIIFTIEIRPLVNSVVIGKNKICKRYFMSLKL